MPKEISLRLREQLTYKILIRGGIAAEVGRELRKLSDSRRAVVMTSRTVGKFYGQRVADGLKKAGLDVVYIEVADGERSKSLAVASKIYDRLIDERVERFTPVIAVGGGVVGDLAGFVSATYLRGLPYVQVPTTLLAQVDSSVGGKTAVNHKRAKNVIGSFYQPSLVLIDPDTLSTLPLRQLRAGLAEVIKYAFLDGPDLVQNVRSALPGILAGDLGALEDIIHRCCAFKARVVEQDQKEHGLRAILNYGHTIGHALEAVGSYRRYLHGEAIAIGMFGAALVARKMGLLDSASVALHSQVLMAAGLPQTYTGMEPAQVYEHIVLDKKRRGDKHQFVLLDGIGKPIVAPVTDAAVRQALRQLAG